MTPVPSDLAGHAGPSLASGRRSISPIPRQPKQIEALLAQYVAGASVGTLSRQFGLHHQTVTAHLRRHGVIIRRRLLEGASVEQIITDYQASVSIRELAAEHRVSYDTVRRTLIRAGLLRPGKRRGRHVS